MMPEHDTSLIIIEAPYESWEQVREVIEKNGGELSALRSTGNPTEPPNFPIDHGTLEAALLTGKAILGTIGSALLVVNQLKQLLGGRGNVSDPVRLALPTQCDSIDQQVATARASAQLQPAASSDKNAKSTGLAPSSPQTKT